jgi:hypothetical protein
MTHDALNPYATVHRPRVVIHRKDASATRGAAYCRRMELERQPRSRGQNGPLIVAGVIVIAIGVSLLGRRMPDWEVSGHLWPLILILIGIVKLTSDAPSRPGRRPRPAGLWLVYLGLWGLLNEFHLFGFDYHSSWPLVVIGAGLMIMWRASTCDSATAPPGEER